MPGELQLRAIEPGDMDALQELLETDQGYAERVTGYPPGASDALSLVLSRPEQVDEEAKLVLGAWDRLTGRPRLAAVIDLLRGYPKPSTAFVGLLQVRWELQRSGIGGQAWKQAEAWIARHWPEVERLRLAVVEKNATVAQPFWERRGFAATGERTPYRYDKLESTAVLFEKALAAHRE